MKPQTTTPNYTIDPSWVRYEDVKEVSPEEYFQNNSLSVNSFRNKYLIPELGEKTPADVFWRVVSYTALPELRSTGPVAAEAAYEYWRRRWFHEIYTGWWMPAGSILQGAANPKKISQSNCTTLGFGAEGKNGDSLESIFETSYAVAKVAAYRQGLGVHFDLRAAGLPVNNSSKESLGNTHWMKYFNEIGNYIGQKGRIPAMLFSIHCNNPDLVRFITVKSDQQTIPNANISVHFTNKFMQTLQDVIDGKLPADTQWEMVYEGPNGQRMETSKPIVEIFDLFVANNWAYAEPGAQFIDTAHKYSNSDYLGDERFVVRSTNACSEQFLEYFGVNVSAGLCVLASANFFRLSSDITTAKQQLRSTLAPSIIRFLDNVVETELVDKRYPIEGQKVSLQMLRRVGAGITNLDGWLIRAGIGYDTQEGIDCIVDLADAFNAGLYETSIALGHEKGSFGAFNQELYTQSPFVQQMAKRHGLVFDAMRNVCCSSIAPTGTLSSMFNTIYTQLVSYGVEPIMGFYWWKRERTSGQYVWTFNVPRIVRELLAEKGVHLGMQSDSIRENAEGNLGESIAKIIEEHFPKDTFKPAHAIDPFRKVDLMAELTAKCVDSSISVTYNLPKDVTKETIRDLYLYAWKREVKSIAVYRDESRVGIVEFVPPRIAEARFTAAKPAEQPSVQQTERQGLRTRPEVLNCDVHHITVRGEKWVVFVGTLEDKPFELFAGKQEAIALPKKYTNGVVKRDGSKKVSSYIFESGSGDDLIQVSITKSFTNDEHSALTRQISLSLRHNVPLMSIIDQLDKAHGTIIDFSKAVTRVLKNYLTEEDTKHVKCKECGSSNIVFAEKCFTCQDCGSSKCG